EQCYKSHQMILSLLHKVYFLLHLPASNNLGCFAPIQSKKLLHHLMMQVHQVRVTTTLCQDFSSFHRCWSVCCLYNDICFYSMCIFFRYLILYCSGNKDVTIKF